VGSAGGPAIAPGQGVRTSLRLRRPARPRRRRSSWSEDGETAREIMHGSGRVRPRQPGPARALAGQRRPTARRRGANDVRRRRCPREGRTDAQRQRQRPRRKRGGGSPLTSSAPISLWQGAGARGVLVCPRFLLARSPSPSPLSSVGRYTLCCLQRLLSHYVNLPWEPQSRSRTTRLVF
jgi:hypothetical protein